MYKNEFTKHWDNKYGFTYEEALEKKQLLMKHMVLE